MLLNNTKQMSVEMLKEIREAEYKLENENHSIYELCVLHNNIATMYHDIGNRIKTIEHFERLLQYNTTVADVYNNLYCLYREERNYKKALEYALDSFRLGQTEISYKNLADLYFYMKDYKKSVFFYKKTDSRPETLYHLAFPVLAQKQFIEGYQLYENRLLFGSSEERVKIPSIPYWDGESNFDTLLIIYEQGIGDNIQYYRFVIELAERFPDSMITYFCRNSLAHLFKTYTNIIVLTDSLPLNVQSYQYKMYIMSLPYYLKIDKIVPNKYDYIQTNPSVYTKWKNRLSNNKFKIGLFHKGRLGSFIEKQLDLTCFEEMSVIENIQLISLHRKEEIVDTTFANNMEIEIFEDLDKSRPFEDTVEIMRNLDLVITVDSSIVHLAGVLGVKTFLMLGYGSDWRWFNNDERVWYDSVELIRINENIPFSNICPIVKKKVLEILPENQTKPTIQTETIQIGIGELWDKFSILMIKKERIQDELKRQYVSVEMEVLEASMKKYNYHVDSIFIDLKAINEKLWIIEENIRRKEQLGEFDNEFIEYARSVYKTNDKRAECKKKINIKYGSAIQEVKDYQSMVDR
jgi:ADP-heptose:LPS heptosyltransferase